MTKLLGILSCCEHSSKKNKKENTSIVVIKKSQALLQADGILIYCGHREGGRRRDRRTPDRVPCGALLRRKAAHEAARSSDAFVLRASHQTGRSSLQTVGSSSSTCQKKKKRQRFPGDFAGCMQTAHTKFSVGLV